ncbi:MAG: hypothetical protein AMXMBFR84_38670 [Candidatus Hydrogenedentota bacterium]
MTWWNKLSDREQRLAMVTAGVLVSAAGALIVLRCLSVIGELDETILQKQQDLLFYSEQALLSEVVDRQYNAMAEQHSSVWTEEEIHDRLRREIARLAMRDLSPTASETQPAPGSQLVEIRQMPRGIMDTSGLGYRAYQVSFRTEPTDLRNLVEFLQRLMQSSQAFRIDNLVLTRQPLEKLVTAQITVTRTIIDSKSDATTAPEVNEVENLAVNGGFESWDDVAAQFPSWNAPACEATRDKSTYSEGSQAAHFKALSAGAAIYQIVEAPPDVSLTIDVDAAVTGTARLELQDAFTLKAFEGGMPMKNDGKLYRYRLRFNVPAGNGVSLAVPVIVIEQAGTAVTLDRVNVLAEGKP